MAVPYTFGTATASIPLSNLDSNFATTITLGNTAIQLGNTVTTLNNMTLANVTVSSGSVTLTNIAVTTANVTTANVSTALSYSGTLTGGTGIVNLGSGQFYKDASGNVGIGTTSPAYKLDVAGTTRINNGALSVQSTSGVALPSSGYGWEIYNVDSSNNYLQSYNRTGSAYMNSVYNALSHQFYISGTEKMRIDSSGSALINQTASYTSAFGESPRFQVSQLRGTSPSIPAAFYCFGNDGVGARIALSKSRGTAIGTQTIVQNGDELGGVYFCGSDGTNMNQVAASITGVSGGVPGATADMPGALLFNTTADGAGSPTERMRIDSSGIVTMSAYGAGAATFSAAGVISSVSDETWKIKDGVPVDPDAMLKKLEPGYWYYNDEKKETFGTDRQLGFYAQNVNAAIGPEAAPIPEEGKPWGYHDRSVLAVTVMSLQKALATIESLTARITALEAK